MTSRLRHLVLIAGAFALAASTLAACGASSSDKASSSAPTSAVATTMSHGPAADGKVTGSIDVADQTSDGLQVVVAKVDIEAGGAPGWIALHKDLDGKPGPVKYQVAIPAGKSTNVVIKATEKLASGAYWPMLHIDDHVIGTYEFPQLAGADLPVKADGDIVMKKIMVTVT